MADGYPPESGAGPYLTVLGEVRPGRVYAVGLLAGVDVSQLTEPLKALQEHTGAKLIAFLHGVNVVECGADAVADRAALVELVARAILPPLGDNRAVWSTEERAAYDAEHGSFTTARNAAEAVWRSRSAETILTALGTEGRLCVPGEVQELLDEIEQDRVSAFELGVERDKALAEVERLRGELNKALDTQIVINQQRGEAITEIERMRGLFNEAADRAERLDLERNEQQRIAITLGADVERLERDLAEAREQIGSSNVVLFGALRCARDELRDAQGIQAALEWQRKDAAAEVERLRGLVDRVTSWQSPGQERVAQARREAGLAVALDERTARTGASTASTSVGCVHISPGRCGS